MSTIILEHLQHANSSSPDLTIDSAGNISLKASTIKSPNAIVNQIQLGDSSNAPLFITSEQGSGNRIALSASAYKSGTNWNTGWNYVNSTEAATQIGIFDQAIVFRSASSGTEDSAITWSETMRVVGGSGSVGIGTDSPQQKLHVNGGAGDTTIQITNSASGSSATDGFSLTVENPSGDVNIRNREATNMRFYTSNDEKMRIDSGGKLSVGMPGGSYNSGYQEELAQIYNHTSGTYNGRHYLNFFHDNNNRDSSGDPTVWGMAFGYDSNTRGGIQYDHKGVERMTLWSAYGDMHFKVGPQSANQKAHQISNSAMQITHDGEILKPLNPSFQAYRNQSGWTVTAGSVFVFDNTVHNRGGHYNTSNGRFTAPVDGIYQFNFHTIYSGNAGNDWISIRRNGVRINGGDFHFSTDPGSQWDTVGGALNLYLNASDYVQMIAATEHYYHGSNWSNFSGYLVG